jgi:hypothetical protein
MNCQYCNRSNRPTNHKCSNCGRALMRRSSVTMEYAGGFPNQSQIFIERRVIPRQIVKPIEGPRGGIAPPVERWIIHAIGLLISLNLLFAFLIVTSTRLSALFQ